MRKESTPVNFCGMGCGEVPDEHFDTCPGLQQRGRKWICDCGNECLTIGGDVDCGDCGKSYNAWGQELRSDWRDNPSNYDDNVSDLDGYEIQHADA